MIAAALLCLIVGVADGDTLTARCGQPGRYEQIKVRLAEIDAPEKAQPFGARSKESLSDLCYLQQAAIRPTAKDRYGRLVARVECRGRDANLEQVRVGMAWAYTQYQTDASFPQAEQSARTARLGLWRDPVAPVPPWQWRREVKALAVGGRVSATAATTPGTIRKPTMAPSQADAARNVCHTGPRGGTYTIEPNGRKNYAGC